MKKPITLLGVLFAVFVFLACKQRNSTQNSDTLNVFHTVDGKPIRNQYKIGSCTSFGLVGMLEHNFYLKSGISVDLSERYAMRENMFLHQNLAFKPGHNISVTDFYGVVPEAQYPYEEIKDNRALWDVMSTIHATQPGESWDSSTYLKKTLKLLKKQDPSERSRYLSRPDILGPFSNMEQYPKIVGIPVSYERADPGADIPEIEGTPCFDDNGEATNFISPKEFASHCMKIEASEYFFCNLQDAERDSPSRKGTIRLMQQLLNANSTTTVAIRMPNQRRTSIISLESIRGYQETSDLIDPTASAKFEGFHEILVTGYISPEEFKDPQEHARGFLATSEFERINLLYDVDLVSFRELLYGPRNEMLDKLSGSARVEANTLIARRRELLDSLWTDRKNLSALSDDIFNDHWVGSTNYLPQLYAYKEAWDRFREAQAEIAEHLISNLPDSDRRIYRSRHEAYKTADQVSFEEYPLEIVRHGDSQSVVLRGTDWRIKTLPVPPEGESPEERLERRLGLKLAELINQEGALFFLRNSWSDTRGYNGYDIATEAFMTKYTDRLTGPNLAPPPGVDAPKNCRDNSAIAYGG